MTISDRLAAWLFTAWDELTAYFETMSVIQWCIVSASAVVFGFLCLKGNPIRR